MKSLRTVLAVVLGVTAGPLSGQSNGPLVLPGTLLEEVRPVPQLRFAEEPLASPLAEFPAAVFAARRELQQIQEWNDRGRVPERVGIVRPLPEARVVELAPWITVPAEGEVREHAGGLLAVREGAVVWGAGVRVDEAWRLRLHLSGVRLPPGARLWVYGSGGEVVGPFGSELAGPDGGLWTPSVEGPEIRLEVELPAGVPAQFTLDRIGELLAPDLLTVAWDDTSCYIDGRCVGRDRMGSIDLYRRAVARLFFQVGPFFAGCTGGLINDTDTRTVIPYLLTANHCISTQAEAATVEAYWDFATTRCNGAAPPLSRLPRSNGASLVATGHRSVSTDFTLLRLRRIPAGRVLLGWNAAPGVIGEGTRLYRLSHPEAFPQIYSETLVDATGAGVVTLPRPRFIYAHQVFGATFRGGSGAPVLLSSGQIVGQLFGGVGPDLSSGCNLSTRTIDGALVGSFSALRPFLDPPAPCRPGPDTLCLLGNRFRVKVSWQNQFDGTSGVGRPISRSNVTGFFSFGDPSNVELLVKILDFGGEIKVFWGQLTNLRYNLEVMDTRTGRIQNYSNTAGDCGGIDQDFATQVAAAGSPLRSVAACRPGPATLCLQRNRFAVEVDWRNPANGTSGQGGAAALSNVTGTFTFSDRSNVELMVKMLAFGDRIALFWGALSDLDYTLKVTDTTTGTVKTYRSTPGRLCGGLDNNAF
jgi:hypothetical protein